MKNNHRDAINIALKWDKVLENNSIINRISTYNVVQEKEIMYFKLYLFFFSVIDKI